MSKAKPRYYVTKLCYCGQPIPHRKRLRFDARFCSNKCRVNAFYARKALADGKSFDYIKKAFAQSEAWKSLDINNIPTNPKDKEKQQ